MSDLFHLSIASKNSNTGPIPVSSSPSKHCPKSCPFNYPKSPCYGKNGPSSWHWNKIDRGERGVDWPTFLEQIRWIPARSLWRHNQVGDLPQLGDEIDVKRLFELVEANRGKRGFTYTHHSPLTSEINRTCIAHANREGFTVNLSAHSLAESDTLAALNIAPVVSVVPASWGRGKRETVREWKNRTRDLPKTTPAGRRVKYCPAKVGNTNCANCKLCADPQREEVILFPGHGAKAKQIK